MSADNLLLMLGVEVGAGGLTGYMLGYGLKKIARLLLLVISGVAALFSLPLIWLMNMGVITVNYDRLAVVLEQAATQALTGLSGVLAQWSALGGSFAVGLTAGLTKG